MMQLLPYVAITPTIGDSVVFTFDELKAIVCQFEQCQAECAGHLKVNRLCTLLLYKSLQLSLLFFIAVFGNINQL